ncbi:hypothetical protein ABW19_dt0204053 [Dactylella cylindrospora]|nr:hypothetical protein ABW19_dt0204053 [Dactylella cylindrospora]
MLFLKLNGLKKKKNSNGELPISLNGTKLTNLVIQLISILPPRSCEPRLVGEGQVGHAVQRRTATMLKAPSTDQKNPPRLGGQSSYTPEAHKKQTVQLGPRRSTSTAERSGRKVLVIGVPSPDVNNIVTAYVREQ